MIGFPGFALGLILVVTALPISRATPRWVPAALASAFVGVMALGETSVSWAGDLLLTAGFIRIGLSLWKATAGADVIDAEAAAPGGDRRR